MIRLLTIKDEKALVLACRVLDVDQEGAGFRRERRRAGPGRAWDEDVLRRCAGLADGVHDYLHGVDPVGDGVEVVRLVHDTEYNALVGAVLLRELRPKALELCVGGAALGNDGTVPAGVVMLSSVCRYQHVHVYNR